LWVGRDEGELELVLLKTSLNLDILSAIIFLMVLIHFACMPTFEPIKSPQENLARALPMVDFLLVCKVQFKALVLSVTHSATGCGLLSTLQD
jgi:hypothetical protein